MLKSTYLLALSKHSKPVFLLTQRSFIENNKLYFSLKSQRRSEINLFPDKNENFQINRLNSVKLFHTDIAAYKEKDKDDDKILMHFTEFERQENKNKKTFLETVRIYESNFQTRKNAVDFIKIALNNMKEFGVHEDLESYKKLLNVLPKGVYIAKNKLLAEMLYFPRQSYVANELLNQLEQNGVYPDVELGEILINIFGKLSLPCRRYFRMMYWTTKFKNKTPWPLPKPVPSDAFLLGKLAIERITSVDVQTEISVFETENVVESVDKTWIVSGQSPKQKELLANHLPEAPVIVEGGDIVWLYNKFVSYFVLKADSEPLPFHPPEDLDDISKMESPFFNPNHVPKKIKSPSVHEQDDGIIYAVCVTGTSSKDSLLSWVRLLQKNGNQILEKVPVLFRFKTAERVPAPFSDALVSQQGET